MFLFPSKLLENVSYQEFLTANYLLHLQDIGFHSDLGTEGVLVP